MEQIHRRHGYILMVKGDVPTGDYKDPNPILFFCKV